MGLKTLWPDYENCISNLPNSIMRKFVVEPAGKSLPLLDRYLKKDYKNIVIILLDGMGVNIMRRNLDEKGFFRRHLIGSISSTFPPTTVAATTSILCGLMPCEHAWLGWDCYYPQVGKNVTVYKNTEQDTDTPAADYNIAHRYTAYESIFDRFSKAGKRAYAVTPFNEPYPDSFEGICALIKELCREDGEKYIYAYWSEPDHTMHRTGCFGDESKKLLNGLQNCIQALCGELEDSLVIVTADHGHIDSKGVCIRDYPTVTECLLRMPSIEPRALNLFVKAGMEKQFEEEFTRFFGKDFILMKKEEAIEKKLFGKGNEHPSFRSMLGDYFAIAVGGLTIFNTKKDAETFIGVHAGLTEDEMRIPLIIIEK